MLSRYPAISSFLSIAIVAAASLVALPAQAKVDPLFQSDELLQLTIRGPIRQLNSERDQSVEYDPASVIYNDENGDEVTLSVKLGPRGNKRLSKRTCKFPPIRLNFKKSEVKGTLFHKQDKLKLVVQCSPGIQKYEQYVIAEYLSYKILNLLTPNSFKVRLAEIRYEDDQRGLQHQSLGFFIEHNKRIAKRIDRDMLKIDTTDATHLDSQHMNLVSMFQFLIANTDWSATHGGNEECCHNGKLFGEPKDNNYLYIPYDFDMSGLVNPEYGATDAALKLDSVRERRFRGYCRNTEHLDHNIALFNANKRNIIAMFDETPYLSKTGKRRRISYIEKFYGIINDPNRIERKIMGWCHESQMITKNP